MLSRVGTLVLIAVVAGPTVLATVCEIVCATRVEARASGDAAAQRHACHDTASTSSPAAVTGQGPVCGHDTASLVWFGSTPDRSVFSPAWIAVTASPVSSVAPASPAERATNISPENHSPHVPLRI